MRKRLVPWETVKHLKQCIIKGNAIDSGSVQTCVHKSTQQTASARSKVLDKAEYSLHKRTYSEEENAMRKTIHLMGMFVLIFSLFISLFPAVSFGEILTIRHAVKQTFGGGQSPDDARISGMAKAKREALEKAGTYIESLTVVQNSKVEKDEIIALTAGVLKAEVISQDNFATKDAFGIEIIVNVVVDTSVLEERVKKQLQDRTHLAQLKDTQKRETAILQKVAQLEVENRKLTAEKQSTEKLKKEFQQASDGLTAEAWFYKAQALRDGGKYTDPKKAIEYLSNAIKLQPGAFSAYHNRGITYFKLGQYRLAIEDFNETIRIEPNDADAYNGRGGTYVELDQYQRAIEDFNEAIRIKLDFDEAYYNRGIAYARLDQYQRAIEDYNKAISLQPDFADAYNNRGLAYAKLRQYQRAIEDFNEAIRIKPGFADDYNTRGFAYEQLSQYQLAVTDYTLAIHLKPDFAEAYYNRGNVYGRYLGQYQNAIEDYNEAIRLKPDYVSAYGNRGLAYLFQGNNNLGCRDAQKACALGDCKLLEFGKGQKVCR